MAVKIRKRKVVNVCHNCKAEDKPTFDLKIGEHVHELCAGCMHELLQKLIIAGQKYNEVC